jgi:succinate dehydrogenase hydrophobic anchor subunit
MKRSKRSLFYVAAYLTLTGIGLVIAPRQVLHLLFSNGVYDDVFPRFTGVLMVGLGIFVIQIIRHEAETLYPSTLQVRAVIWVTVLGFYFYTNDPFFLVVLGVVGLGMIITGTSYYRDRRTRATGLPSSR